MEVSVITPTFNRQNWFPLAVHCFKQFEYPQKDKKVEWIILDDSNDSSDLTEMLKGIPNVVYKKTKLRMTLGQKRNELHKMAKGEFIVHQDDDDYYPPLYLKRNIQILKASKAIDIIGSSIMNLYFCHNGSIVQFGPYGNYHATAATWIFKKSLLERTAFDPTAERAEEAKFLKQYTIPMIQNNDIFATILAISHMENTVDKIKMLDDPDRFLLKKTLHDLKAFTGKDKWAYKFIMEKTKEFQDKLAEEVKKIKDEYVDPETNTIKKPIDNYKDYIKIYTT